MSGKETKDSLRSLRPLVGLDTVAFLRHADSISWCLSVSVDTSCSRSLIRRRP